MISSLGFFSCSSVFYCVSVCFKIREFFIYFIKIKAVVLHIQIVVRDALTVILYKENLMLKRKKESFLLHHEVYRVGDSIGMLPDFSTCYFILQLYRCWLQIF